MNQYLAIVIAVAIAVIPFIFREWVIRKVTKRQVAKELNISPAKMDEVIKKIQKNGWDEV